MTSPACVIARPQRLDSESAFKALGSYTNVKASLDTLPGLEGTVKGYEGFDREMMLP